jgi:hypothetical protein
MAFPLEKILTMSARDYCEMMGKRLTDYVPQGVHTCNTFREHALQNIYNMFAERVPESAEVVVDYMFSSSISKAAEGSSVDSYASGTALIPRDNSNRIHDGNDINPDN